MSNANIYALIYRILFPVLIFTLQAHSFTKEQIISRLEQAENHKPPAYEAKFTTAAYVQGMAVKDSGFVTFTPPSCYRIILSVSKNETSTCGDTTWMRAADGTITVTANKNTLDKVENQGIAGWRGSFSPVNLMKRSECSIKSEGKDITVALTVSENKTKTEIELTLDTTAWVVSKSVMKNPQYGKVVFNYKFFQFDGKPVISEINTEMGSLGRISHIFYEFKKIKRKSKKFFRML